MTHETGIFTTRRLVWAAGAVLVLLLAGFSFAPVRALAQEFAQFFTRTERDSRLVAVVVPTSEPDARPDAGPAVLAGTLDEVVAATESDLLGPAVLPAGYTLEEACFDPETGKSELFYRFSPMQGFVLTQQSRAQFDAAGAPPVGPAAAIAPVTVGGAEGQYVEGLWIAQNDPEGTAPGELFAGELVWQPLPMARTLVWEQEGFVLTLTAMGDLEDDTGGVLQQADLIELAETLVFRQTRFAGQ